MLSSRIGLELEFATAMPLEASYRTGGASDVFEISKRHRDSCLSPVLR